MVKFIASKSEMFCRLLISRTLEQRTKEMQKNTQWGTHVEIHAAASLFQAPEYVATDSLVQGRFKWTIFKHQEKSRLVGTGDLIPSLAYKQHLELCNAAGTHYDSVTLLTGDTLLYGTARVLTRDQWLDWTLHFANIIPFILLAVT